MRIAVTGAAGFIGSHLVEMLLAETDHTVLGIDNFCDYYSPKQKRENVAGFANDGRVVFREADVTDADGIAQVLEDHHVDAVIHLAAHAGVTPSVAAPRRYFENNVMGTLALVEAARLRPLRRFVFVSSSTVYGTDCPAPFREDGPLGVPASPYGASKRAAEIVCETYHKLHCVPTVIIRPFSVYGPRLRPDLALSIFATRILRGEEITVFGDGSVRRDFTHVSDICRGLITAAEAPGAVGQAINLGHDQPLAIQDVLEHLQAVLGRRARIVRHMGRPEDLPVTHADLGKAKRILGYANSVDFEDGLRTFVEWLGREAR